MVSMAFNKFQSACIRTANPELSVRDQRINWALGLAGESGEFVELIKKGYFHGKHIAIEDAKKELGDVLYYVAQAATSLGLSLEEIAQANVDKLLERYPNGFVAGGGIRSTRNNDHEDDGC